MERELNRFSVLGMKMLRNIGASGRCLPIGGNHGLVPSDFSVMHTECWLWVGGRTGGGGTGPWGEERK